jgi:ACR3 family arsenite efflux pump ArsB
LWQNVVILNVAVGSTYNTATFGLKMINVNIIISLIILIYSILYYINFKDIRRSIRNLARNIMELLIYIKRKPVHEEFLPSSVFHSRESVAL